MRVVAERAGRALGLPHRWRLRRVTRHRVAGAGAMLRGHLPVFHDLLDLGSFVLKPDFHLGGGEQRHTLPGRSGACPRASPRAATRGLIRPPGGRTLASPRSWRPMVKGLDPRSQSGSWAPEGPPLAQNPRLQSLVGAGGGGASVHAGESACVTQRWKHATRRHERRQNNRSGAVRQGRVRARWEEDQGVVSPLPDRLLFLPLLLGFEDILYSSVGPRGVAVGVKGTIQGRLSRATAPPTSGPPQAQGVTLCFRPPARGLRPPRGGRALLTPAALHCAEH